MFWWFLWKQISNKRHKYLKNLWETIEIGNPTRELFKWKRKENENEENIGRGCILVSYYESKIHVIFDPLLKSINQVRSWMSFDLRLYFLTYYVWWYSRSYVDIVWRGLCYCCSFSRSFSCCGCNYLFKTIRVIYIKNQYSNFLDKKLW